MYWKNLSGLSPYTYCPYCKVTAPPIPEEDELDENEEAGSTPAPAHLKRRRK